MMNLQCPFVSSVSSRLRTLSLAGVHNWEARQQSIPLDALPQTLKELRLGDHRIIQMCDASSSLLRPFSAALPNLETLILSHSLPWEDYGILTPLPPNLTFLHVSLLGSEPSDLSRPLLVFPPSLNTLQL